MFKLDSFNSIDEAYIGLLRTLLLNGQIASARNMKALEIYPVGFLIKEPRARCITNHGRRWSLPLAIGEFAWHLSGSNSVDFISYYAKQWKHFSEDGLTIKESCYGYKIFKKNDSGKSQWEYIIGLLTDDIHTRRAVIKLINPLDDYSAFSKDVSCICTIQFLVRNGKLDAITHMRSNDVILGLPYDVFLVTMMQEYLSQILLIDIGHYYHFTNSMHLYEKHFSLANNIINSEYQPNYKMPKMTNIDYLKNFIIKEEEIRLKGVFLEPQNNSEIYWKDLLSVLNIFHHKKLAIQGDYLESLPDIYKKFMI